MMRSSVATKSARKLDSLSSYFRAIGKYPPLTREEEHVLAVRAGLGDPLAKQQLARHNLVLVISDATHLDLLEADAAGPESSYLSAESDRAVRDALAKVRKRVGELGLEIVRDRLQQDPATTLAEIGKRWSISRERVRQVEVRTKQLLSRHLEPVGLEAA